MKLILNIRGTNGAGKSTIPMSMMDDPEMYVITKPYQGKPTKIATVFPTYGWIALGTYFNKTGGLDTLRDNKVTKKAFHYVLKNFPEYHLLLEGIISSTIFSTYLELFQSAEEEFDRKVVVLHLIPELQTCLDRIQKRNGGKPIKTELVEHKQRMIGSACRKFSENGIKVLRYNNQLGGIPPEIQKIKPLYKLLLNAQAYLNI